MGFYRGPRIITDSLVLYLDAANPNSYSGSGTTWSDLSGNGNNGTLVNGSIFSSDNKGIFNFDGIDDYCTLGTDKASLIQNKTNISLGIFFKMNSLNTLRGLIGTLVYSCTSNLGLVANSSAIQFYNDTTTCYSVAINGFIELNKWIYFVGTYDGVTTRVYGIKDGILSQNSGTGKSGSTNSFTSDFRVMGNNYSLNFTDGYCSTAFVYNKTLNEQEVLQNYNATKSRFGL